MIAEDIQIEWDEGGCYLHVDGETWRVADPEQLYDRVKAAILPWLMEKWDAEQRFNHAYAAEKDARKVYAEDWAREAYDVSDPKHPDWHSVHSDIWDARTGK